MHTSNSSARIVLAFLWTAVLVSAATGAQAQAYPNRPIHIIAPFPAGGGYDFLSRLVGAEMSKTFGQPVVVENKAGANGNGSPQHLAAEQLKRMAGIDLVHVPYKGAAPTAAALLAGEVSIAFNIILLPLPHVHAGKLTGLAVASAKRSPLAPDIPTLAELGYPIDIDTWYGLVAPAGTPKEVVAKLNAETLRILNLPELRERTRSQGIELAGSTPEQLSAFLKADIAKWTQVIREFKITVD